MTTGELTKKAIDILKERGCDVWRVNNIPVRRRQHHITKGKADIQGYHKTTGLYVVCEVKNEGDTLSDEQKEFLLGVSSAGGFAYIAVPNLIGGVQLIWYRDYNN